MERSVWNRCVGRSEVRVGPPGEVCVCGGEPGSGGQDRSGSRGMWRRAEQRMWKRDVTYRGFQPARILVHVRRADTQIWQCLAETAFSRKSKLTMFDVGGLCWENCCQTRVEFFCPFFWSLSLHMELVVNLSALHTVRNKTLPCLDFFIDWNVAPLLPFQPGDLKRAGAPSKATRRPNCLCLRVLTVHVGARAHLCLWKKKKTGKTETT